QLLQHGQSIEHLNLRKIGYLKSYNVFNVACVEGLPEEFYHMDELEQLSEIERDERAESMIREIGAEIVFDAQNEAYYKPSEDKIYMPLPKQFVSKEAFLSVMYHEIGHWTGAAHRLNRPISNAFANEFYAFEELIAELSSAFMLAYLGYESRITDNAAYIENWLSVMKNDTKFVIQAASQAQAASDYILQLANVEIAA
ncbi:MAG TPA: zincin-like metallopeptidase domain-containing protein, partial [Bacteroidales bacterium]|nr:zincin-like metallopeptidase domain-containing protein [Bacteroidales bacterium]